MKTPSLTLDQLKASVSYDPGTGIFIWVKSGPGVAIGKRVGSIDSKNGYRVMMIDGVMYNAQRLAWFWTHGTWPKMIRFQNGDRDDCRIDNLCDGRLATTKHDYRTKEGKAAAQKEYRSLRREVYRNAAREAKFGITLKQYGDMLLAQNGCCAICKHPETATRNGVVKALAVDHDHETGAIRGLLCVACNTGIGKFKDDRNLMLSAVKYLDTHKGVERVAAKLELVRNE